VTFYLVVHIHTLVYSRMSMALLSMPKLIYRNQCSYLHY